MNTLLILLVSVPIVVIFIFWGIFRSKKKKIKYYHKSKILGENYFEQSD